MKLLFSWVIMPAVIITAFLVYLNLDSSDYCSCKFENVVVRYNADLKLYALQDTNYGKPLPPEQREWGQNSQYIMPYSATIPNDEHKALEWLGRPRNEFTWSDSCAAKRWLYNFRKDKAAERKAYEDGKAERDKLKNWK